MDLGMGRCRRDIQGACGSAIASSRARARSFTVQAPKSAAWAARDSKWAMIMLVSDAFQCLTRATTSEGPVLAMQQSYIVPWSRPCPHLVDTKVSYIELG